MPTQLPLLKLHVQKQLQKHYKHPSGLNLIWILLNLKTFSMYPKLLLVLNILPDWMAVHFIMKFGVVWKLEMILVTTFSTSPLQINTGDGLMGADDKLWQRRRKLVSQLMWPTILLLPQT